MDMSDFYNNVTPEHCGYLKMTEWSEPIIALWLFAYGYKLGLTHGVLTYWNKNDSGTVHPGDRVFDVTGQKVVVR